MPVKAVACVIPARLNSSRFPEKLLYSINGVPVICHTIKIAVSSGCFKEIICVTDSEKIGDIVSRTGCRVVMSGSALNGTERIAKCLEYIQQDLIVNLQGDEPVFPESELIRISGELRQKPELVHILVNQANSKALLNNPNRVKVITDDKGRVADFVRVVERDPQPNCKVQLGIYAYSKAFLKAYGNTKPSKLEVERSHELLRDMSIAPIQAHYTEHRPFSVDVPQDLAAVKKIMAKIN